METDEDRFPFWAAQKEFLAKEGPTLLLFRHAARQLIQDGMDMSQVLALALTDKGRTDARDFGQRLAASVPRLHVPFVLTSPVQRCKDTAALVAEGAGLVGVEAEATDVLLLKGYLTEEANLQLIASEHRLLNDAAKGTFQIGPTPIHEVGDILLRELLGPLEAAAGKAGESKSTVGLAATHDAVLAVLLIRCLGAEVACLARPTRGGR